MFNRVAAMPNHEQNFHPYVRAAALRTRSSKRGLSIGTPATANAVSLICASFLGLSFGLSRLALFLGFLRLLFHRIGCQLARSCPAEEERPALLPQLRRLRLWRRRIRSCRSSPRFRSLARLRSRFGRRGRTLVLLSSERSGISRGFRCGRGLWNGLRVGWNRQRDRLNGRVRDERAAEAIDRQSCWSDSPISARCQVRIRWEG
jgi:hypothetical protein